MADAAPPEPPSDDAEPAVASLFRAVSAAECEDVLAIRRFRGTLTSYEGKLFALSAEDAAYWARELFTAAGGEAVILEVKVRRSLLEWLYHGRMDRREVIAVDETELAAFNDGLIEVQIWRRIPVP